MEINMEEKFIKFYKKYYNDVFRLAYSYTLNSQDSEDICQRTFTKFYDYLKRNNFEEEKVKAFLFKVAINDSKNILVSSWRKLTSSLDKCDYNLQTSIKNNDLLDALKELSKSYRIPLYLYYYEGYSIKEISELLKSNESTVKTRLKRGKEKLKELMEGNYERNK